MAARVLGATDRTISAIRKAAGLKTDITSGRPDIDDSVLPDGFSIVDTFFAVITLPDGESDFTDARYWVSPISFAENVAGALTITVDTDTNIIAHNIAEMSGIYGTDPNIERNNLRKNIILKADILSTTINLSVGTGGVPLFYVYVYVLKGTGTQNADGYIYIFSTEAPRFLQMDDILIASWTADDCPDAIQYFHSYQQVFSLVGFDPSP